MEGRLVVDTGQPRFGVEADLSVGLLDKDRLAHQTVAAFEAYWAQKTLADATPYTKIYEEGPRVNLGVRNAEQVKARDLLDRLNTRRKLYWQLVEAEGGSIARSIEEELRQIEEEQVERSA